MSRVKQNPQGQAASKDYPISIQQSTDGSVAAATSGASVQASVPAQGIISGIMWSYSGPVTTGGLNIADSSGTLMQIDIHAGSGQNFGQWNFAPPISSQISTSVITVTLTGNAAVTGKLNLFPSWQEV